MFRKILIANRGEIACRVIATARRLGVKTVAVYSGADAAAKHVQMADEAVHIGGSAVGESYLKGERIIEAARRTGAQAIHPGYGFLSENPDFVEAVEAAGLVFIGPPASAIKAMGLKDAAKALMEKAGVPVVPGYHGTRQEADFLAEEAQKIGYPVLIKARAGGGGKGMRLVENARDFPAALESAQREGKASFGDAACLIEKYITSPRHVEIQVFADAHGNVVHLFERDCSLQRRHQKVIEEAPAPGMSEEVRAAMGAAAVEAARAIGYQGAGTVEFIADGSRGLREDGFWFMEMNTRLQVEHPVTEAITGLDLVELQLRAASGEPLPFTQDDLSINGHAFEARIYAEDVEKGFLPATGTLEHLYLPQEAEFAHAAVRVDSGVREGDTITPFYDPMIAKLIVHGADRAAALGRLATALGEARIAGTTTNIAFLAALARHEGFARGDVDTGLIGRDIDALTAKAAMPEEAVALAALASLHLFEARQDHDPWHSLVGWRPWGEPELTATLEHEGERLERRVVLKNGGYTVEGGEKPVHLSVQANPAGGFTFATEGHSEGFNFARHGEHLALFLRGATHGFSVPDPLTGAGDAEAGGDQLVAPMPGFVIEVKASAGDKVEKGQPLMVLEAMKMELTLNAPRDGTVAEVLFAQGEQVTDGTVLLTLEPESDNG